MAREKEKGYGVLAAIAVFKLLKAALMIVIGIGAIRYMHRDLAAGLETLCHHLRADPHNRILHGLIEKTTGVSSKQLELLGIGTFVYAAIFIVEGVGLLMRQRWAEWLTIVSGSLLIPFEIYEIIKRPKITRIAVLIVNIAIVVYLIIQVRRGSKQHQAAKAEGSVAPQG